MLITNISEISMFLVNIEYISTNNTNTYTYKYICRYILFSDFAFDKANRKTIEV